MKIKKNDKLTWGIIGITMTLATLKICGVLPVSWWIVTFFVWFPLAVLGVCGLVLILAIVVALFTTKGERTENENEDNEDEKRRRRKNDAETEKFVRQQRELGEKYGSPNLFILND